MNTKTVYLDYTSHPITVSIEGYDMIVVITQQHAVCNRCGNSYSEENPKVAENCCLSCFLGSNRSKTLTFLGLMEESETYHYKTYTFLDSRGYVYTSYDNSANDLRLSNSETLRHYGFTVPQYYLLDGKQKRLDPSDWRIHGNLTENSVIVIEYKESYGDQLHVCFLTSRDGGCMEMNKRRKEIRTLFKQARDIAEASKDQQGYYHIGDYTTYQLFDSHLYDIISDLASHEHDEAKKGWNLSE